MLGIDIGSYSIKAAVVKKSGKRATIEQIACEVLPAELRGGVADTNALQSIITNLIKKVGKGQKTVALSIPTSSVILKTINVDANLSDNLLEGEVQMELVNFVPFPLDQVYADYVSLGKSSDDSSKQVVFVAASRRDLVDKIASTVKSKSIQQKEIDVEAFAIGQVLEQIKGKNYRQTYAVIDVGYQSTSISVFKNGDMLFNRDQQIGGQHLTEAIAEVGGMTLDEAESVKLRDFNSISESVITNYLDSLSEQISLAMEFFSSTNSDEIEIIYLTGGGAATPGLINSLTENLPGQTFKMLPIGQDIQIGRKTNGLSPDAVSFYAAVAAGLAMRK